MAALLFIGGLLLAVLSFGVEMSSGGAAGLRTYSALGCMVAGVLYSQFRNR